MLFLAKVSSVNLSVFSFSRQQALKLLFTPILYSGCRSIDEISDRAIRNGLKQLYQSLNKNLDTTLFLQDIKFILPPDLGRDCGAYAVWTALMAEAVGFQEVKLLVCSPAQKQPGGWNYHAAMSLNEVVLDAFSGEKFERVGDWLSHLHHQYSHYIQNSIVILHNSLKEISGLFQNIKITASDTKLDSGLFPDDVYEFASQLPEEVKANELFGLSVSILFCRHPQAIIRLFSGSESSLVTNKPNNQPANVVLAAFIIGIVSAFLLTMSVISADSSPSRS